MSKNFMIRNVSDEVYDQLKSIAKKYDYASFNQFMLDQIQNIVMNDGLNIYQNQFAKELSDMKKRLSRLLDVQLEKKLRLAKLEAQLEENGLLLKNWISFMEDIEALEVERNGGKEI